MLGGVLSGCGGARLVQMPVGWEGAETGGGDTGPERPCGVEGLGDEEDGDCDGEPDLARFRTVDVGEAGGLFGPRLAAGEDAVRLVYGHDAGGRSSGLAYYAWKPGRVAEGGGGPLPLFSADAGWPLDRVLGALRTEKGWLEVAVGRSAGSLRFYSLTDQGGEPVVDFVDRDVAADTSLGELSLAPSPLREAPVFAACTDAGDGEAFAATLTPGDAGEHRILSFATDSGRYAPVCEAHPTAEADEVVLSWPDLPVVERARYQGSALVGGEASADGPYRDFAAASGEKLDLLVAVGDGVTTLRWEDADGDGSTALLAGGTEGVKVAAAVDGGVAFVAQIAEDGRVWLSWGDLGAGEELVTLGPMEALSDVEGGDVDIGVAVSAEGEVVVGARRGDVLRWAAWTLPGR